MAIVRYIGLLTTIVAILIVQGEYWSAHADSPPPTAGTRKVIRVNGRHFVFRWCPPGEFMMGSPEAARDQYGDEFVPQHRVRISRGFWLQETEVTQAQYRMVMDDSPSFWQYRAGNLDHPVERVTWTDASEFCRKLSELDPENDYRLPTEAEWERACRTGGAECRYGDILEIAWVFMNTDEGEGSTGTRPVGTKKPNAWGLHDMFGNVSEWCYDWHGPPPSRSTTDPTGPTMGERRIARGDRYDVCWTFLREDGACMAGSRSSAPPEDASKARGFRVVLIPPDEQADSVEPLETLQQFLSHLARGEVERAHSLVAPSSKELGDPIAYRTKLDFESFRRELRLLEGPEKFVDYRLGQTRWEAPGRFRAHITLAGWDNDETLIVQENGKWYVADPIHIIR